MMKHLFLLGLFAMLLSACGDDEEQPLADINIRTQMNVNGTSFNAGDIYTIGGVDIAFTTARYYMGGINVETSSGAVDLEDTKYIMAIENPETESKVMTFDADATVNSIAFHIGVSPEVNALDEDTYLSRPADDPLAMQDPAMHWTWNSGYRFIRLDGFIDNNGNGMMDENDTPVAYHTGTNPLLRSLVFTPDQALTLKEGNNTIVVNMDLAQLFDGVDLTLEENHDTHTGNNLPLATTISDNIVKAVSLQVE